MRKGIKNIGKGVLGGGFVADNCCPWRSRCCSTFRRAELRGAQGRVLRRRASWRPPCRVDRVDIGIFSKVRVKGFYVEDYQRDTLLYVGKLDAFITSFGIFGGGLELSRGEIAGREALPAADARRGDEHQTDRRPHFRPRQTQEGQFPPLAEEGPRSRIRTSAWSGSTAATRSSASTSAICTLYGITAYVNDFTIDGQAIYTSIARPFRPANAAASC